MGLVAALPEQVREDLEDLIEMELAVAGSAVAGSVVAGSVPEPDRRPPAVN